jgi:hypothetical protein
MCTAKTNANALQAKKFFKKSIIYFVNSNTVCKLSASFIQSKRIFKENLILTFFVAQNFAMKEKNLFNYI